jgi:enolase
MAKILKIIAQEILDSRGNPTVEVELTTQRGVVTSSVPSGASVGTHEALELRDNDPQRYDGKGILKAVENVEKIIAPALIDNKIEVENQELIDSTMIDLDGSEHKTKLGANAILAVSAAVCKAGAQIKGLPLYQYIHNLLPSSPVGLPTPMFNLINGGAHADNNLKIQEFMIVPTKAPTLSEKVREGVEIFWRLKKVLKEKGLSTAIGDEGGFAPDFKDDQEAMEYLSEVASGAYLAFDLAGTVSSDPNYYQDLINRYPIIILEDPASEDAWDDWKALTEHFAGKIVLVGDDLFVTEIKRLEEGIRRKVATGVIIKPNQVGTVWETLQTVKLAQANKYVCIVSHRSGETNDTFISDLAVGIGAQYVKFGAPSRGERVCKYNRLMAIEKELQSQR